MRSFGRRRLPIVIGTGAACIAALGVLAARFPTAPDVSVAVAARGRFVREVEALGVLQAVKATPIIVPTDASRRQTIASLAADGSRVKAGEIVVVFDATDATRELENGRTDHQTAVNNITKTRVEGDRKRHDLTLDRKRANEDRERAEDVTPTDEGIFSRHEIIESRVDRELLDKKKAIVGAKLETSAALGRADVALTEVERAKADIRIRQAQQALNALRVAAPQDGLLVLERSWRGETISVGDQVWPGQKIAEIPQLSELEAKVYVLEADAGGLAAGRGARIIVEGKPGAEYAGRVSRVDAIAKPRDWRSPVKYFEAFLAFDRKDAASELKLGQLVRAKIVLEEIGDALLVPRGALFEKDGKRIVYQSQGGRFRPVEVVVGSLSVGRAVISQGIAAGDRVALRDPTRTLGDILKSRRSDQPGGREAR